MKNKLSKIFVAIAMLLSFVAIPKVEVKANQNEEITPYSITVPVDVSKNVYTKSSNSYPYIVIKMTGTMVRGADKNVTSYNLSMSRTIKNSSSAGWQITSATITSRSFQKSGTGVIGNYTLEVNLKSLTSGAVDTMYISGQISCGV